MFTVFKAGARSSADLEATRKKSNINNSSFRYEPLNESGNSIRLLIGEPRGSSSIKATDRQMLTFKLIHSKITLTNCPRYAALSYDWGDATSRREIIVNGAKFSVTQNLYWALYHLQQRVKLVGLWVEAICVNQEDIEERNSQVKRMPLILSNAENTFIWLGLPKEERRNPFSKMLKTFGRPAQWFRTEEQFTELASFSQISNWRRTWIVQEVALSERLSVCVGAEPIDWDEFINATLLSTQIFKAEVHSQIQRLDLMRRATKLKVFRHLRYFLEVFGDTNCIDPRDKVFAFLSLADDCQDGPLRADYSKSIEEVCFDLMLHFLPSRMDKWKTSGDRIRHVIFFLKLLESLYGPLPSRATAFYHRKMNDYMRLWILGSSGAKVKDFRDDKDEDAGRYPEQYHLWGLWWQCCRPYCHRDVHMRNPEVCPACNHWKCRTCEDPLHSYLVSETKSVKEVSTLRKALSETFARDDKSTANLPDLGVGQHSYMDKDFIQKQIMEPPQDEPSSRVIQKETLLVITHWAAVSSATWVDRGKEILENLVRVPVLWWPLAPRKTRCAENNTRVSWKCVCNAELYFDIPSEEVDALQREYASIVQAAPSASLLPLHSIIAQQLSSAAASQSQSSGSATDAGQYPPTNLGADGVSTIRARSFQQTGLVPESSERYLHWCINSNPSDTLLFPLALSQRGDNTIIDLLKSTYTAVKGLRRWISLTDIDSVRFVLFKRGAQNDGSQELVVCLKEEYPPKSQLEYEYSDFEPPSLLQNFAAQTLKHHIHYPHRCTQKDMEEIMPLIPKKKNGQLEKRFGVQGWGIQAVPGLSLWRCLVALVLSQIPPLIFGIRWLLGHPGDLQNAFLASFYVLALFNFALVIPERWSLKNPKLFID